MNYSPAQLEELAAAYAIGSLRGRARARFERLCRDSAPAQTARQHWEDRLLPLALAVPSQRVSSLGWSSIRLRLAELSPAATAPAPRAARLVGLRWAAAASIVALGLLFGDLLMHAQPQWQTMATLTPPNGAPTWRVERSTDFAHLRVASLAENIAPNGGSFELWVLPAGGGNPVSLGLIPAHGEQSRVLDERQRQLLMTATTIAVSLEPGGGSPNGLPTQVQFAAPIVTGAG